MPTTSGLPQDLVDEAMAFSDKVEGHYKPEELEALFRVAMSCPTGGHVAEIGVWGGRSSSAILQAARHRGLHVELIDPWIWMEGEGEPEFRRTIQHFRDVRYNVWKLHSSDAAMKIAGPLDMIHIDGNHQLDGVMTDCGLWLEKLVQGGLGCFHDYGNPGLPDVKVAVDKYVSDWEHVGLTKTLLVMRKP